MINLNLSTFTLKEIKKTFKEIKYYYHILKFRGEGLGFGTPPPSRKYTISDGFVNISVDALSLNRSEYKF